MIGPKNPTLFYQLFSLSEESLPEGNYTVVVLNPDLSETRTKLKLDKKARPFSFENSLGDR